MHLSRLKQFWSAEAIATLELQHQSLLLKYQHDNILKSALERCDNNTSFEKSWLIVNKGIQRFDILRDFCGGIATLFPNTATVESDFSVLGWERDEYRLSLTDLSLEGIMQCKQFEVLSSLVLE